MLHNFTGVLAIKKSSPHYDRSWYYYRPYVNGRRLEEWDYEDRQEAESELAAELERLVERDDRS